jgi:hypothetical protein
VFINGSAEDEPAKPNIYEDRARQKIAGIKGALGDPNDLVAKLKGKKLIITNGDGEKGNKEQAESPRTPSPPSNT